MTEKRDDESGTISRRDLVRSAAVAAAAAIATPIVHAVGQQAPALAPTDPVPAPLDPTKVSGLPTAALNARSAFEHPGQTPVGVISGSATTPLQALRGTLTPSDLHFQRHHNGIAVIDPAKHRLMVHGLVERPVTFTVDELKRFPATSRVCFVECAGNGRAAYRTPKPQMTPQHVDGMTSNSEWTGVAVSTLLREVDARSRGKWVLAEGGDGALMARSIPMEKMMDDALVAYAQNGEAVRMANGYPLRLILPGYEGNTCVKWLRRLEVMESPAMTRDETAKYTDPLPGGKSRQFSFVMDAKSLITSPAYPEQLTQQGWWPIAGIAWSGRGRIIRVDVSVDGGETWKSAELIGPIFSRAHTRFQYMWKWNGQRARLMSRAVDESGYTQPTLDEYKRVRGRGTDYHFNHIRSWDVATDGVVTFGG